MANVVLIGMPGVGKSTVGVLLAKRLGLDFTDTDLVIQSAEGKRLPEIIAENGLAGFCDLEADRIGDLHLSGHVIATGGSVVYRHRAMIHLGAGGPIVYLSIGFQALKRRLDDIDARGVVYAPGQSLHDLYLERTPLYARYANLTVDCTALSTDRVADRVEALLESTEFGHSATRWLNFQPT